MNLRWYHTREKIAILALFLGMLPFPAVPATAAGNDEAPASVERSGRLPSSGKVTIRSGLTRMNETSPLFQTLQQSLIPLLAEKGLTVVPCPPSSIDAAQRDASSRRNEASPGTRPDAAKGGANEEEATARARQLGSEGKLPQLRLNAYTLPANDAELPDSVTRIQSPDRIGILFSLSQEQGMPLLNRGGPIPGRIPSEVAHLDFRTADYALLCRFTLVSASSRSMLERGTLFAAAGAVGGVGGMGYGKGGGSAPPRQPSYGGTKGDYARGYEGLSPIPGDPWNRQSDMKARNYMQRYGPEGEFATPPQGAASSGTSTGRYAPVTGRDIRSFPGGPASAGVTGYALELECYSLARVRQGKKPELVWKAVVHQKAHGIGLEAALPGMAAKAIRQ